MNQAIRFVRTHYLFLIIILIALFLRVYRLDELTTFGGDQGIDFRTVRDMIVLHKLTLIGIKTSIGSFYQGPLYLYILLPFFYLFHLQPIAGPVAAVVISIMTLVSLYITARTFFSEKIALVSSIIFAVSPEFVKFGNTPLYQNFLPLFIIISLYLFLYKKRSWPVLFLLGLTAGIGMELHLLNVTLALSYFLCILIFENQKVKSLIAYLGGLILGLSPTIIFELKHQFLNTHAFLQYQNSGHQGVSLVNVMTQWVKGSADFLGGGSMIMGFLILLGTMGLLIKVKIKNPTFDRLKKLTIILLILTFLLSLKFAAFETHYALPVWVVFVILIPFLVFDYFPRKIASIILAIIIVVNLIASFSMLNNNHGYTMPSGWTMRKIVAIGKIISVDSQTHPKFNVASLLDGNTRTYPVRYAVEITGAQPDAVENYPSDDYLYVVSDGNRSKLHKVTTWEVTSMNPFSIAKTWYLGDNIYLYRLDRNKSHEQL